MQNKYLEKTKVDLEENDQQQTNYLRQDKKFDFFIITIN